MSVIAPETGLSSSPPAPPVPQLPVPATGKPSAGREQPPAPPGRAIPDQPQSREKQNQPSPSSNAAASSWQSRLQNIFDTYVPGAHYQRLAQQEFDGGNYGTAAGYQAAALADALLGVATLGAITPPRAAGAALFRRSFKTFDQLKYHLGRAPKDMTWHHIVEQSQIPQFGAERIHSVDNIVAVPDWVNKELNRLYSSRQVYSDDKRVRVWLRGQSFEEQYEFGMERLRHVLGY
jgi:hypothetical protein